MWLFLPTSFLSIVAYQGDHPDPRLLLVRARVASDIERVFPAATVLHTPEHDYAYRATVPRTKVAAAIAAAVKAIDYPNFKNAVNEVDRHDAYLDCWFAMQDLQEMRAELAAP